MLHTGRMRSKVLAIGVAMMMVAWLAPGAQATVSYNLDFVFSGQQPTNAGPWGTISFTDGGANTVNVTMTASNLSATEFISFWGFNSTAAVSGLTVSYSDPDASATFSKCDSSCSAGTFKADGDGFYEIVGAFQTSEGAGRFTNGEILTFTITGTGLTESNFSPVSTGGTGPGNYNTAIHIQGIAGSTTCSAWVGNSNSTGKAGTGTGDACTSSVAEPSILLFAGLSLTGLVGVSRRFMVRREK